MGSDNSSIMKTTARRAKKIKKSRQREFYLKAHCCITQRSWSEADSNKIK